MADPLLWHRIQFAFSIAFHCLFPQLTMGLVLFIVLFKGLTIRRGTNAFMQHPVGYELGADVFSNLFVRPWSLLFVLLSFGGLGGAFRFQKAGRDLAAFVSSTAFLLGLIAATMIGNYPFWLRSTIDPAFSLTAANTASAHHGLQWASP